MPTPPMPEAQQAQIVSLYQQGLPAAKIGAQCNCSSSTVYNVLRAAGIIRRKRGVVKKLSSEQQTALIKSAADGVPRQKLAELFGISRSLVFDILKTNKEIKDSPCDHCKDKECLRCVDQDEDVDDEKDESFWFRGKGVFDGAKSILEMKQILVEKIALLDEYHSQGYEVNGVVSDDYAFLTIGGV